MSSASSQHRCRPRRFARRIRRPRRRPGVSRKPTCDDREVLLSLAASATATAENGERRRVAVDGAIVSLNPNSLCCRSAKDAIEVRGQVMVDVPKRG